MGQRDISTKVSGIYKRLNPDSTVYLLRLKRAGKAYNETYDCFDAAVARKLEILEEIKLAELKKHMPAMRTAREAVEEYRKTPRTGNAMHNQNVAYRMDWWAAHFEQKAIGTILSSDIQMGINQRLQDKKTASTAIKYLNAISLLFDAAKSWGWVQSNPAKEVLKPRVEKKRRRTLSRPEQTRLLKACLKSKNRLLYPLVLLALKTGCRQNELMTLRWRNVDLKSGVIVIEDVDTKAKHARTLPINSGICHFLAILARSSSGVFVFGGGAFTNHFQTAWESALKRAKLEDFCFHGLRHTRITEWVQDGIQLQKVQQLSGHRTIQMLMHYSHLGPHAAIEAARQVR
jgi:integrase